ncbi:prepilin-type N-terminal cleavage/methylation domain-containing protein [Luteimonas yindakuii]|uniref:Type II secretion system protein H n=1 Tax=Luteimonas yindakuii TaxID=2565782 RepID=A0A4Z1R9N6_9GAMM|nr:GspH/FimT family pseudopilin [Luteimonas yindakuii]TKS55335.1 prepilin-type N-terminal cleavage/methylation domain-containing protein [Luteimonas yindakuii]
MEAGAMKRRNAGVTLIELMTVLTVLAVSLTIGLPAFTDTLTRLRVQTAMHRISADLAAARSTAIARRSQLVVCPRTADHRCREDSDWTEGWMFFLDPDGNRQPEDDADILGSREAMPKGLTVNATRRYLRYQHDGRSAHSNQTVRLCAGEQLAGTVVVNNFGRVRSERPKRETACPR